MSNVCDMDEICEHELEENKKRKLIDKELWEILNEILIFTTFFISLTIVAYSNISNSSIYFNQLYQQNFVTAQSSNEKGLNEVNK